MPDLFLDSDGVMANFDGYFDTVFNQDATEFEEMYGAKQLWRDLSEHHDFYYKLPVLEEGRRLYEAVKHLNPTILTGRPRNGTWAIGQKHRWYAKHFPGVPVIVCLSRDKCHHMIAPGDVLVDDRLKYKPFWVDTGGVFVHHRSTEETLVELRKLGML